MHLTIVVGTGLGWVTLVGEEGEGGGQVAVSEVYWPGLISKVL